MHQNNTMSNTSENSTSVCANCGKGEESNVDLKACSACQLVKYCNRECQLAHRPQHKKECKKRAAELHEEASRNVHVKNVLGVTFPSYLD